MRERRFFAMDVCKNHGFGGGGIICGWSMTLRVSVPSLTSMAGSSREASDIVTVIVPGAA